MIAIIIIPIPPSHCRIALHNKILFGISLRFEIIVDPVVVIPDILSKKALVKEKFRSEKTKGKEPNNAILNQDKAVNAEFDGWGSFALILFLGLMFIGGCAGSTTCGVKIFRIQILYLFVSNQLKKIIYPKGVFVLKYDQNPIDNKFIASIISFIYMYLVVFFSLTALLSLTGLDFITSISGAATSISNVGPGLGSIIGPNGNFSTLPDISKWILSFGMILGRLELFAVLVLFLPSFWRN